MPGLQILLEFLLAGTRCQVFLSERLDAGSSVPKRPWDPQQIFVRGKKSSSGSTKGGVSLTRDDGINLGLDYNLSRSVDLSAGCSYSAYSVLNTVSFGVELNVGSWLRKHRGQ